MTDEVGYLRGELAALAEQLYGGLSAAAGEGLAGCIAAHNPTRPGGAAEAGARPGPRRAPGGFANPGPGLAEHPGHGEPRVTADDFLANGCSFSLVVFFILDLHKLKLANVRADTTTGGGAWGHGQGEEGEGQEQGQEGCITLNT